MGFSALGAGGEGVFFASGASIFFSGGEISGRIATWTTILQVGGQSITLNYRGEVDGNRMTGSAELGNFGSGTFTAEKKP